MTKLYGAARQAEAVVGVVEVGRTAGASGAARDFYVMAPRSAAGRFTLADRGIRLGAAGIALGRGGVIIGIVPIAAPLVYVVAHVVKAEGVGSVECNGLRAGLPAGGVVG